MSSSTVSLSDTTIVNPPPGSDEEKQESPSLPTDDFLVKWDGETDPLCPYSFSIVRKWLYVFVISMGSLAVTAASSIYGSIYEQILKEFHCSKEVAILGLSLFVIGLAVGPMVVAPLSEFYGRRPIYLMSIVFFLIWTIPCAVAQNIQTLIVARFLAGLSGSAFLSVAAGTVSDLFIPSEIQVPMMMYTVSPFLGPILGPLIGGFICQYASWRWTFYVLLIWTAVILIWLIFTPETYHPVLLARKADSTRKRTNNPNYHSASELTMANKSIIGTIVHSLWRPFQLLFLEPMILLLCLYSALLLGIVYLFFGAFPLVFTTNHGFKLYQNGLTFIGLMVGIFCAVLTNPLWTKNYSRLVTNSRKKMDQNDTPKKPDPEFRLPPAIAGCFLVPIGLFWFGWTTYSSVHWIVPIIGSVFFMAGVFLAFTGILTFLVDAYPTYAASATAANVFVRCMFAGAFPLFGDQMYEKLDFQWASSLLGFLAVVMIPFPYLFFRYGKLLRAKSKFAAS